MKRMNRFQAAPAVIGLLVAGGWAISTDAALVAHYKMNAPTQLVNSVATNFFYEPNMVLPSSPATPVYLPTGGFELSGAFQFDGVDDYIDFDQSSFLYAGLTTPSGAAVTNQWTVSFRIQTTDTGSFTGYTGTTQVPVWGNTSGGFGMGIDGGKATFKTAFTHQKLQGVSLVADGQPHYVAFVARLDGYLDIYVDGLLDAGGLNPSPPSAPAPWPQVAASELGRGYWNGSQLHYGSGISWTLDDMRVYNHALNAGQVFQTIPEPGVAGLILAAAACTVLRRRRFVTMATSLLIATGAMLMPSAGSARAASITFHNTSSSHYIVRNESDGNVIVVTDTSREASNTYTLTDNKNYRLHLGQPGDQGTHFFKVNASGQIAFDPGNPATQFFFSPSSTSLTIGSIPVYLRQLSGSQPNTTMTGGSSAYFADQTFTALGIPGTKTVNLTPDDRSQTPFSGFTGNWKNIFPYSFVQQTPVQLGPLTDVSGNHFGITSMTNPSGSANPGQTTIVSSALVKFFEGGKHYRGFQFTIDRLDSAQPGDGSEWLYFTEIPEPAGLALLILGVRLATIRRFRR